MIEKFKNVLVLAPHTDDGELGAGATIAKLVRNNAKVSYVAFSGSEESVSPKYKKSILREEVIEAVACLGIGQENVKVLDFPVRKFSEYRQEILEKIIKIRNYSKYDLVLLPSRQDFHQDHQTITNEGIRAFKNITVLGYELIWNNLESNFNCMVEVGQEDVSKKISALNKYVSQSGRRYMSEEFIKSLAIVRGCQYGTEFAESFDAIRIRL